MCSKVKNSFLNPGKVWSHHVTWLPLVLVRLGPSVTSDYAVILKWDTDEHSRLDYRIIKTLSVIFLATCFPESSKGLNFEPLHYAECRRWFLDLAMTLIQPPTGPDRNTYFPKMLFKWCISDLRRPLRGGRNNNQVRSFGVGVVHASRRGWQLSQQYGPEHKMWFIFSKWENYWMLIFEQLTNAVQRASSWREDSLSFTHLRYK